MHIMCPEPKDIVSIISGNQKYIKSTSIVPVLLEFITTTLL